MIVDRFEVYLVSLDPTQDSEIKKTRPCCVISPNEMNHNIATVIVAPTTSKGQDYQSRVKCNFHDKEGQLVLDQIRTVDKSRLVKKLGQISVIEQNNVISVPLLVCNQSRRITQKQHPPSLDFFQTAFGSHPPLYTYRSQQFFLRTHHRHPMSCRRHQTALAAR